MTIGDVLAVIALVLTLAAGWTATLLLAALAFPERVRRCGEAITASTGLCLARGAGMLILSAVIAGRLGHHAAGPVRLIAGAFWGGVGLVAALGSAGIARLLGGRIRQIGTDMTPFAALTRGTALYVLAGLLPVVGWFLITPLTAMISLGAAFAALRPVRSVREAPPAVPPVPELGLGVNP